jgi:AraC-like DNA-binding protein
MAWSRFFSFDDPEAYQAAIQGGQLEILPTAKGRFQVEMSQVRLDRVWMQRFHIALPQVSTAMTAPERKAIAFLTEESSPSVQHCGMEVTPDDIIVCSHGVWHQRSLPNFHYGSMSVSTQDFPHLYESIVGRELRKERSSPIFRAGRALMSQIRAVHKEVGQLAKLAPDILDCPAVVQDLEERLIQAMVRCFTDGSNRNASRGAQQHELMVSRFEQFLEANENRALYLSEICAAIGVSERTLRFACEDHMGMGPIRFLSLRRMHLAHRALLQADPVASTVTEIATGFGFWELGRFSVAYRRLFGESPSATLRRPARRARSSRLIAGF